MQNRMPILVALVVGVLAVVLTNMYVTQVREESLPEQTLVVVASTDLAAGTILESKDVAEAARFTQALPKLHIPYGERNLYLGQELRSPVSAGDYVLVSYFGAEAGAARLSEKVNAKLNQRAFTISVTAENSLESSVRAGDRIDLLVTYAKPPQPTAPRAAGTDVGAGLPAYVTATLLENVYVLSTGRFEAGSGGSYRTLTLMGSADEAKLITWAAKLGDLTVLLRNPKDLEPTDRAYLSGDLRKFEELGKIDMRIGEVVDQGNGETPAPALEP